MRHIFFICALSLPLLSGCSMFKDDDMKLQYSQQQQVHAIHQNIIDSMAYQSSKAPEETKMQRLHLKVPAREVNGVAIQEHEVFIPVEEAATKTQAD